MELKNLFCTMKVNSDINSFYCSVTKELVVKALSWDFWYLQNHMDSWAEITIVPFTCILVSGLRHFVVLSVIPNY